MTEYGTPPPGGWPAGQAPHGSHEYTAPSGYRPTTAFDPKTVNPLDWAIMVGAVLALIFSFFDFYKYTATGPDAQQACHTVTGVPLVHALCNGVGNSAWHGFFGWFGVLLVLVAGVVVAVALFAPQVTLPAPARMIALVLAALGFIFVLVALFVVPDGDYQGSTIPADSSLIDAGHGFAYWVVLIVAAVVTALCALRLVQTKGGTGVGTAAGAGMSQPGQPTGYPPQPQQGYGQPQGYAPPPVSPQQSGYQQPGYQQPGYQQQPPGVGPQQPGYPPPGAAPQPPPAAPPPPPAPAPQAPPATPQAPPPAPPPAGATSEPSTDSPPEELPPGYTPPPPQGPRQD